MFQLSGVTCFPVFNKICCHREDALSVTKLVDENRHLNWKSQSFYDKNVGLAEVIPNNTNTPKRAHLSYKKRECIINTLRSREGSFEVGICNNGVVRENLELFKLYNTIPENLNLRGTQFFIELCIVSCFLGVI